MTANRDIMSTVLSAVYGPSNNLADWEGQHWVAVGYTAAGPGDKAAWYAAQGAAGTSYGDLECDYWTNVYAGGGGTPPSNTVAPLLSGSTAALGNSVSTGNGTWTGDATITFTYQWQVSDTGVGGWSDISGETASSITIEAAEQGKYIRCVVTGTNGAGNSSANSDVCAVESAGLTLLKSATLWLDASDPGSDPQKIQNKGTGGSVLDARFGSTTGVDSNDPLLLTHSGTNYLYLPGLSSNACTIPDAAALRITGDIDIKVRVALADWTPSSRQTLTAKRGNAGSNYHHSFCVSTGGAFYFEYGDSSTTVVSASSSVANTLTDGTTYWVRVTRSSSTGDVKFYTAADSPSVPSSWTQLGTTQATAAGSIYAGTDSLCLGGWYAASLSNQMLAGNLYRALIQSGIDGTAVFDADFTANTNQSSFTESSSNAATVTINRATSGRKSVMVVRPTLLFGTDDYLEVPDNSALDFAASDSFSALVVARVWATPANYHVKLSKGTGSTSAGWLMWNDGTFAVQNAAIADGTVQVYDPGGTYTLGQRYVLSLVRDVSGDTISSWLNTTNAASTTDTTTATLANAVSLFVGRSGSGTPLYSDMELDTVAVFPAGTILNATTIGQIMSYLGVS